MQNDKTNDQHIITRIQIKTQDDEDKWKPVNILLVNCTIRMQCFIVAKPFKCSSSAARQSTIRTAAEVHARTHTHTLCIYIYIYIYIYMHRYVKASDRLVLRTTLRKMPERGNHNIVSIIHGSIVCDARWLLFLY